MRLLRSRTLQFEVFYGDAPPYAILSHTWGSQDEEATFQDLRDETGADKPGYAKIKECCAQAVRDGLEYVWIDTCCIDKTNSVELQEAINSMFTWYKRSTICYAYLSNYSAPDELPLDRDLFKASKWFTRGWTLQELIAPAKVHFFSQSWKNIGSKTELRDLISGITRIKPEILAGQDLELCSVAQRMSWASMRETTRPEDIVYCLFGIFGITLPLIYGEGGQEAFIRLQKEIMEKSDDHSLFAWKQQQGLPGHGLLASSPALFAESSSFIQRQNPGARTSYGMTNRGLKIQLSLTCTLQGGDHIAVLGCEDPEDNSTIGIYLALMDDGRFVRTSLGQLARIRSLPHENYKPSYLATIYIPQLYLQRKPIQREYEFRVVQAALSSPVPLRNLVSSALRAAPSSPVPLPNLGWSPFKAVAGIRFTFVAATSPPHSKDNGELEFTLTAGGMVGMLFIPSMNKALPWSTSSIAIVFGVNLEDSFYGNIIKIKKKDQSEIVKDIIIDPSVLFRTDVKIKQSDGSGKLWMSELLVPQMSEWLERYLLNQQIDYSKHKCEKNIRGVTLRMEITSLGVVRDGKMGFQVYVSY